MAPSVATTSAKTVAVIGAGVVGLCTALQAQRNGYQVTLVDRGQPGAGVSFGNAGYLATELIDPLANGKTLRSAPHMLLNPKGPVALPPRYLHRSLPWLLRFIAAARPAQVTRSRDGLRPLNREAVAAWQRTLADIDASDQLRQSGYLLVWESAERIDEATAHSRYLAQWQIACKLISAPEVARLEPALAETVSHALYFPDAYQVREPYRLCQRLFEAFRARGGQFAQQAVASLKASDRQVTLLGDAPPLTVDTAVVCAGAWSRPLLQSTGIDVPLEAERGYHISLRGASIGLNRPIGSAERRFVMSPLDSGLRAVGFTEIGGLALPPIPRRFQVLRQHSQGLIPALNDPSIETSEWMGHRPTLPDSLPVIDRHPTLPQLLFAFGHQHLGLTQAAVSAEMTVSLMGGRTPVIDPRPYRVGRF